MLQGLSLYLTRTSPALAVTAWSLRSTPANTRSFLVCKNAQWCCFLFIFIIATVQKKPFIRVKHKNTGIEIQYIKKKNRIVDKWRYAELHLFLFFFTVFLQESENSCVNTRYETNYKRKKKTIREYGFWSNYNPLRSFI